MQIIPFSQYFHKYHFIYKMSVNFYDKSTKQKKYQIIHNVRLSNGDNFEHQHMLISTFMHHFERKFIDPFLGGLSLSHLKFIDNLFFTWTGSKDQLKAFLNDLHKKCKSIKFEYMISQSSIPFLDTNVYIKNQELYTKIYNKETDRQNFLHNNSERLTQFKNIILYSQVLRVKYTLSTIENFKLYISELQFIEKSYKFDLLDKNISTVEK